jgi:Winged helix DNA-binding domain
MRRIGVEERRARLAVRHHLAPAVRAGGAVEAARGLVGLHATDPASVFLAAQARIREPERATVAAIEEALYEQRALIRMLGMRRTMFVVPAELAPVVHASCTRAIAVQQRALSIRLLRQAGIGGDDVPAWLEEVEASTLRALTARGEATATELADDEPRLRERIRFAQGKSYGGASNITTRVLFVLAAEGRIVRGRPRGTWTSSQHRWSTAEAWFGDRLDELPTDDARVELVRRWLASFGPATAADVRWWTGWTTGEARKAIAATGAAEVSLDGPIGFVLADDLEPVPGPATEGPWVGLLPALDPTVMGWFERTWYLGEHGTALFDRTGNAGPTIWCDGRVVGGWAQRADGEVTFRLLEDVGAEAAAAIEGEAQRLRAWIGEVRVTPRFRTPLERELSA